MINTTKRTRKVLIFFLGTFLFFFIALLIAPSPASSTKVLDGYVQLIENAAVPIFLVGQEQKASLQLGSLIQNTPIQQIRIYDTSSNLLLRIQNTVELPSSNSLETFKRQVSFEDSFAGILELDIEPTTQTSRTATTFVFAVIATIFATLVTGLLILSSRYPQIFNLDIQIRTPKTAKTSLGRKQSLGTQKFPTEQNLLVLVRIRTQQENEKQEANLSEQNFQLAELIGNLADIYGAKPVSCTSNTLVYTIPGKPNSQNIQQSLVLCWGLAQLSNESTQDENAIPSIQAHVIDSEDLSSSTDEFSNYMQELESRCASDHAASAYIGNSLTSKVDSAVFELSQADNEFMKVSEAAASIKNLWKNQRTKWHL